MKTAIALAAILALSGCATHKVSYQLDEQMTPGQMAEAACKNTASLYRDPMFPDNIFLNAQGYRESFDNCMKGKGYIKVIEQNN